MTKKELKDRIQDFDGKLGMYQIALNRKQLRPFTYGYVYDEEQHHWLVYDVGERNDFGILASCDNEEEALEKLFVMLRYRYKVVNGK